MKIYINSNVTKKIEKAKDKRLGNKVLEILKLMESMESISDLVSQIRDMHKMVGPNTNLYSCRIDSKNRLIFTFDENGEENKIMIIDFGSHDQLMI